MLKFKINIADALGRVGFGGYDAKKTGYISQDTLKKLMDEDTRVTLESLNRLCVLLDMELKDIIAWEMSAEDAEDRKAVLSEKSRIRGKRRESGSAGSSVGDRNPDRRNPA
ncbi:MAG: helix-turn-helix transcriptional regulator [Lachnospiraceae bacterium]